MKLDLAADELVEDTATLPINPRYEDQEEGRCRVYTLEEIAAEKLRCVMQRLQCRDLYDLHELLVVNNVDAEAIWPLFERKARHEEVTAELTEALASEAERGYDLAKAKPHRVKESAVRAQDSVAAKLDATPYDGQELTDEDLRAIKEAKSEPGVSWSNAEAELNAD